MDSVELEHDEKGRDRTTYLTYDEQGVSRDTIDQVVQALDRMTYWTYDERPIDRITLEWAIRAPEMPRERLAWLPAICLRLALNALSVTIVVIVWVIFSH
jgi:hypothetical protein